ncbi:AAA domain-containing protein [Oceanobacillus bengalensis]|uniref:DNA helicase n=1 Tax=Oceanobacillus bengalensis TaxID=1435466 RepID=A0A494Z3Q5_9BACI|nr:AAA domain-containing protein [Oceanobacillus bengalensis]RKQ17122.1 hypothetical protein D8M05_05480 [Oceanobacillus bengalensis]
MATIQDIISQWKKALQIEINFLKKQGGNRIVISDGKCIRNHDNGATYWFSLTSEATLPDGSAIRIEYKGKQFHGRVISVQGFDVVLEMDTYFGDEVDEAFLYSEAWELLVELTKRLDEMIEKPKKLKRVTRLLLANSPTKHPKEKIKNALHEVILRAKYNPTTYIWGPPGTGKTYTLARAIAKHYEAGKKILVMAHSNAAVDVLTLEVANYVREKNRWKTGDIVRNGYSADPRINGQADLLASQLVELENPTLQEKIESLERERYQLQRMFSHKNRDLLAEVESKLKLLRASRKKKEGQYVKEASVLGVTLSKAAIDSNVFERDFDLIVIDEVSMAYVPQIAFATSLGRKVVVCGDFKQLPPIAMAEYKIVDKWLKRDIFQVAKIEEKIANGELHPNLFMLNKQRRMHPAISSFTNHFIYQDKVTDHQAVRKIRDPITAKKPFNGEAGILVDVSKMGAYSLKEAATESRYNLISALLSLQFILSAKADGMKSIGVIAPYRAQARLLSACIQDIIPENTEKKADEKIVAATVHKFQGSERDMIVFDNVDSYPQPRPGKLLTDATSERLINVAVTRARAKFINIVDRDFIQNRITKNKATRALSDHLSEHNKTYSRHELLDILTETYNQNMQWFSAEDLSMIVKDIRSANKITISAPYPAKIDKKIWAVLREVKKKAEIIFITPKKDSIALQSYGHIPRDLVMPFIEMDKKIMWVGTPVMNNTSFESSPEAPFIMCRLVAKNVISLLYRYFNLQKPQYDREEIEQKVVSHRNTYTLSKYISIWDRCPTCQSSRKVEVSKGNITLVCSHCGTRGRMRYILERYIEYVDLRCKACNGVLDVPEDDRNMGVECSRCNVRVNIDSLL